MAKLIGTQSVDNSKPGVRDIKPSIAEYVYRSAIVASLGIGLQRACVVTDKLDTVVTTVGVLDERTLGAKAEREELRRSVQALADDLKQRQAAADIYD